MGVDVVAQMVASVAAVTVAEGQDVAAGDTLLVVESMKMQIPITAPVAGRVAALSAAVGDIVEQGDVIARIDPA